MQGSVNFDFFFFWGGGGYNTSNNTLKIESENEAMMKEERH